MNAYFTWIGNFGVVPLFLLDAFLFAPMAFFLFSLRVVVTLVLDTIKILQNFKLTLIINSIDRYNHEKLTNLSQCVKNYSHKPLKIHRFILVWVCLFHNHAMANSGVTVKSIPVNQSIMENWGEVQNFQIKDPNLLKADYHSKTKNFTLFGKKSGSTLLRLFFKNQTPKEVIIQIHDQQNEKDWHRKLKLSTISSESNHFINGEIHTLKDYTHFYLLSKTQKKFRTENIELSQSLQKTLWLAIYKEFLTAGYYFIKCQFNGFYLHCVNNGQKSLPQELKNSMLEKWAIQFFELPKNSFNSNFEIKLKIIQIENTAGNDIHLGLDQLSSSLSDFFHFPLLEIVGKNQVLLNSMKLEMNVLSEPKIQTITNYENIISVGSEIPFHIKSDNGKNSVVFKFAGLKVKMKILENHKNFILEYETELSKPESFGEQTAISGNKQQSSVIINPGDTLKLFEIEFITSNKNLSQFPGLSSIPLLGKIFQSQSDRETYKKIVGLIQVVQHGNF